MQNIEIGRPITALAQTVALLSIFAVNNTFGQSADLGAFVDSLAAEHVGSTLVGMSVGVTRGDNTLLKKSYGYANLEWQVPMPMDAVHEVGSLTKQFTAVALLQLASQGRVNLDADISEYVPEFDTQGRRIPVRRLTDHTSGMKGITEIPEFWEINIGPGDRTEVFDLVAQYPFDFEPGNGQIYNNSAYMLMGHIIERTSGQSYESYLEEHVYPLANLQSTSYCSNTVIVQNKATGYQYTPDGFTMARYHDHTWPYSAGSLCSTVSDLISWNQALHHGEVLSDDLYEMLITPQPLADGSPLRYAMGVFHYMHPTGRVIEHSGEIDGFFSFARYYPDDDVTVVVLHNAASATMPVSIADHIGEHLFSKRFELEAQPYSGDLTRFAGEYRGPGRGAEMVMNVAVNNGELRATASIHGNESESQSLNFFDGNTFFDGITYYIFDLENNGTVSAMRFAGPGNHYVLERQ